MLDSSENLPGAHRMQRQGAGTRRAWRRRHGYNRDERRATRSAPRQLGELIDTPAALKSWQPALRYTLLDEGRVDAAQLAGLRANVAACLVQLEAPRPAGAERHRDAAAQPAGGANQPAAGLHGIHPPCGAQETGAARTHRSAGRQVPPGNSQPAPPWLQARCPHSSSNWFATVTALRRDKGCIATARAALW